MKQQAETMHARELAVMRRRIDELEKEKRKLERGASCELYEQVHKDRSMFFELPEVKNHFEDHEVKVNHILQKCVSELQEDQMSKMILTYQI